MLIYGANGYTGRLIVERALALGHKPILAGRNEAAVAAFAKEKGLEYRIFSLDTQAEIEKGLEGQSLVIHCAGPFEYTAKAMATACIAKKVHYLDITGEISVFEALQALSEQAKAAGIMLLPGAGFDVVPSDCLAAYIKERLPTATKLEMAFTGLGAGMSRGTATTAIENLGNANLIRENGQLKQVPQGKFVKWIDFGKFKHHCVAIPWGDVSTAYFSTGIPNIIVYMGLPPKMLKWMRLSNWFRPVLRSNWVKNYLKKQLDKRPAGPNAQQRQKGKSYLWGEASDAQGKKVTVRIETPEGYTLTALSSVLIAEKVLAGNFKTGFQTPSSAYSAGLIFEIEGTSLA